MDDARPEFFPTVTVKVKVTVVREVCNVAPRQIDRLGHGQQKKMNVFYIIMSPWDSSGRPAIFDFVPGARSRDREYKQFD